MKENPQSYFPAIFALLLFYGFGCSHDDSSKYYPPNSISDIDGNVYQTVTIGSQVWMSENLKVSRYRDGEPINYMKNSTGWSNDKEGACCDYNNHPGNIKNFGKLYNWFAVASSHNIAPEGWHVPTLAEWDTLVGFLGGWQVAGGEMKDIGTANWLEPNTGATNKSGFTAFAAGYCNWWGEFHNSFNGAYWWATDEYDAALAWGREMRYSDEFVYRGYYVKGDGMSVRCVKDK